MKNIIILTSIFLFAFLSCQGQVKSETNTEKSETAEITNKVQVLEFFGKRRCTSCMNIEKNTKLTLNNHFADEMESGKIEFHMINYDLAENEMVVDKYEAYGTSLYLVTYINGEETFQDLSSFAFMNNANGEKYIQKLKEKIDNQINKL